MTDYTSILGRKYKTTIQNIYPFVFYLKEFATQKEFFLYREDPNLLHYYDKVLPKQTYYKYIDILKKLGILICKNDYYTFNNPDKPNTSREYVINPVELSIFIIDNRGLLDEDRYNHLSKPLITNIYTTSVCPRFENKDKKNTVKERMNMKKFYEIVDRLNQRELLKYNWGLVTTYDGGRATSKFCSLPTVEKQHKYTPICFREGYLDNLFGKNNWEEYDVPSSVPQVFHLLNKGFWLGKRVYNMTPNPDLYKEFVMRMMFNYTDKTVARSMLLHITNKVLEESGDKKKKYYDKKVTEEQLEQVHTIKKRLEDIIGPTTIGKDVFIHESNIYLLVCEELMNRNIDFAQCYDGFYFRKGERPTDMAELVKSKAEEYYNEYYIGE